MPRDLRRYARQTNVQLLSGALVILFVLGLGMVYIFYGIGGVISGLLCILAGLAPVILIAIILQGLDLFRKWVDKD